MTRDLLHLLWVVLLAVTLYVVTFPFPGSAATVDPVVVGTWEIMVPNAQGMARWIWEIRADGTYSFRSEGPGGTPSHSGTVTFSNGQWSLQTTTGLPGWTDGGTYQLPGPDILAATGKLGPGVWQRSKTTDQWPQSVVAMAAKARKMARAKLPDAVLLDIKVEPFPESFPQPPGGTEWSYSFSFWSPSTQNTYTITPYNPAGEEFMGGKHNLSHREPIPERFLEFAEAVKQAQAQGMRGQPVRAALALNAKGNRDVVYDSLTLSEGLTWTLTPRDEPRAYYVRAALNDDGPSDSTVTTGSPESIRKLLLAHTLESVPGGFFVGKTIAIEPSPEERKNGQLGKVRIPGTLKKIEGATREGTGFITFVIYSDRAMAERAGSLDWLESEYEGKGLPGAALATGFTEDIVFTTDLLGEVKAACTIPRYVEDTPHAMQLYMDCVRVDPQLPVVVWSSVRRPLPEGEGPSKDRTENGFHAAGLLLAAGLEHLAAVLERGGTTSSPDQKTTKEAHPDEQTKEEVSPEMKEAIEELVDRIWKDMQERK